MGAAVSYYRRIKDGQRMVSARTMMQVIMMLEQRTLFCRQIETYTEEQISTINVECMLDTYDKNIKQLLNIPTE